MTRTLLIAAALLLSATATAALANPYEKTLANGLRLLRARPA